MMAPNRQRAEQASVSALAEVVGPAGIDGAVDRESLNNVDMSAPPLGAAMRDWENFSNVPGFDNVVKIIRFAKLEIAEDQYCVRTAGRSISLTTSEYRVLWELAIHLGTVVGYSAFDRAESRELRGNKRPLYAVIASLRRKLRRYGCNIRTVRDLGYILMR
jgi:hypothetical protein